MRYRISSVSLGLDEDDSEAIRKAAEKLHVSPSSLSEFAIVRRSLDARKRGWPRWLLQVEAKVDGTLKRDLTDVSPVSGPPPPPARVRPPDLPPIVVGAGPAGLFCAHELLARGVRSIVLDRGQPIEHRRRDVARLMQSGILDPESNMYFGEGGAGAYTDGKLGTRIHHPAVRKVVELFAHYGAVERILSEGRPHVGSDLLPAAVSALRADLERGGCEFHWGARLVGLELREGRVRGIVLGDGRTLPCDRLVLAPGNSARDVFELFAHNGWPIEAKPFAAGFRAEHPQSLIDEIQYGSAAGHPRLPPAEYRLAHNPVVEGRARGVFTFCMCPGGIVVPTPTEPGLQCTNGMSGSRRGSRTANAGVVVAVGTADFEAEGFTGPLAGLHWQRAWEERAYELGGGLYRAPAQRMVDYLAGRPGRPPGRSSYPPGQTHADLALLFPPGLRAALRAGLETFDRRMRGYVSDEAILLGIESRTSSPCRILRGEDHQSPGIRGLYPAGEGAGYAGGIVSSAVDGLRTATAICEELASL